MNSEYQTPIQTLLYSFTHVCLFVLVDACTDPEGDRVSAQPPGTTPGKAIGFISNTGQDPLENHKA